jgi:hypothetical protein
VSSINWPALYDLTWPYVLGFNIQVAALEEMRVRAACNRWARIMGFNHQPYRLPMATP